MEPPQASPTPAAVVRNAALARPDEAQPIEERPQTFEGANESGDGSCAAEVVNDNLKDSQDDTQQTPSDDIQDNARPNTVRRETSVAFSKAFSDGTNRESKNLDTLIEGGEAGVEYPQRNPRSFMNRRGTSMSGGPASVYSSASQVTTVAETQTRYVNMLLALDHIHIINDVLAFVFTWTMLAGFVVLPGTLKKDIPDYIENRVGNEELRNALKVVVDHVPLVAVAGAVSGFGLIGMIGMWLRWRGNYIWLVQKIFLPGCTNALAGLVSTVINIFVINKGQLDTLSIVVLSVVGGVTLFSFLMIMLYQFILLAMLQREHKLTVGKHSAGKRGAGRYKGFEDEGPAP